MGCDGFLFCPDCAVPCMRQGRAVGGWESGVDVEELESADGVGRVRVCRLVHDRAVLPCGVSRHFSCVFSDLSDVASLTRRDFGSIGVVRFWNRLRPPPPLQPHLDLLRQRSVLPSSLSMPH